MDTRRLLSSTVALIAVLIGTSTIRQGPGPAVGPTPGDAQLTISIDGGIDAVDLVTGELQELVPDVGVSAFAWSPDGTELAYETRTHPCTLKVRDIETGDERVLATGCGTSPYKGVDWSADGTWIVFSVESRGPAGAAWSTEMIHPDGTGRRELVDPDGLGIGPVSLSPDGSQVVFQAAATRQLYTMNLDGSDRRYLTHGQLPDWSRDGSAIAFTRLPRDPGDPNDPFVWQFWSIRPDGSRLAELYTRKHCCIGLWASGPVWSPDGSQIAAIVRGHLRLIPSDGGTTRMIPNVFVFASHRSLPTLAWRAAP